MHVFLFLMVCYGDKAVFSRRVVWHPNGILFPSTCVQPLKYIVLF